jgi:hypothetical protein
MDTKERINLTAQAATQLATGQVDLRLPIMLLTLAACIPPRCLPSAI